MSLKYRQGQLDNCCRTWKKQEGSLSMKKKPSKSYVTVSWGKLGVSWEHLGRSGDTCGHLGGSWKSLGSS